MDDEAVSHRKRRPESGVEHPVRVGCERKAVARIVVCAHGMLVNVGHLDDVAFRCVKPVAREGAGELVAGADLVLEPAVEAFPATLSYADAVALAKAPVVESHTTQ